MKSRNLCFLILFPARNRWHKDIPEMTWQDDVPYTHIYICNYIYIIYILYIFIYVYIPRDSWSLLLGPFWKGRFFGLCCRKVLVLAAVFFPKLLHSCVFAALSMDFCCDGSALTLSVSSSVLSELLGKCLGCDGYPRNTQDMNAMVITFAHHACVLRTHTSLCVVWSLAFTCLDLPSSI